MKKLIVLTTGGTIEKVYDERDGSLRNGPSIFRSKILSQLRLPNFSIEVKEVFSKDSLEMTDSDRQFLADFLKEELKAATPIVVIHGTDTMDKSAEYCIKNISNLSAPIIFTGAMKPTDLKDTDAIQNVTEAIMASQLVKKSIYISFHGNLFLGDQCRKNRLTMTFEPIK